MKKNTDHEKIMYAVEASKEKAYQVVSDCLKELPSELQTDAKAKKNR